MDNLEALKKEYTDLIILDLEGNTKEEALLNIAKFAKKEGIIKCDGSTYERFLEYEKLKGTTAVGNGLACPEAWQIEMVRPYAFILCRTKEPIEYNSSDGKPVRIILASLIKNKDDLSRLKVMARLARLLKNNVFRIDFLNAKDFNDVYLLFEKGVSICGREEKK